MPTKFYFHDAAPPGDDPGETSRSVVLPAHTDNNDFGISVRSMDTTIGSSQTGISGNAIATTNDQDNFFTSFSTPALNAQTLAAATWTIAAELSAGNAAANSRIVLSIYVYRPSTTSVVGFIHDSDTIQGTEWNGGVTVGVVALFSASAVVAELGDILVCEFWRHATQGMPMTYVQSLDFDGGTDVLQAANSADAASYLNSGQGGTITFAVPASHEYIPQIKRRVRSRILTR